MNMFSTRPTGKARGVSWMGAVPLPGMKTAPGALPAPGLMSRGIPPVGGSGMGGQESVAFSGFGRGMPTPRREVVGYQEGGDGERVAFRLPQYGPRPGMPTKGFKAGSWSNTSGTGGGGGGGGGSRMTSGGSGEYGFASKRPGMPGPITSDRDGSTVARRSAATPSLLGEFGRNQLMREADTFEAVPQRAHGGPVPAGMPFIAGDPQADGKPNPELIVPTADGVHVVPLKGMSKIMSMSRSKRRPGMPVPLSELPKLAYGTVEDLGELGRVAYDDQGRVVGAAVDLMRPGMPGSAPGTGPNLGADAAAPYRGPMLPSGRPRPGMPVPLSVAGPGMVARSGGGLQWQEGDALAEGSALGTDPSLGAGAAAPHQAPAPGLRQVPLLGKAAAPRPGMPPVVGPPAVPWRAQDGVVSAANPEGIVVGVTPRAPLTLTNRGTRPWTPQDEAAALYERFTKGVNRAARRNPVLAAQLLEGKARSEEAAAKARADQAELVFREEQQTRRTRLTQEGQDARQMKQQEFAASQKAEARALEDARVAEEKRFKDARAGNTLATNAVIAQMLQTKGLISGELAGSIATMTDVEEQNRALNGINYGATGRVFGNEAQLGWIQQPGTDTHYPTEDGKPDRNRPHTLVPEVPAKHSIGMPTSLLPTLMTPNVLPYVPPKHEAAIPAHYKPTGPTGPDGKPVDPAKVQAAGFKLALDSLDAQLDDKKSDLSGAEKLEVQAQRRQLLKDMYAAGMKDLNGDGVPDAPAAMAGAATSAAKGGASALLKKWSTPAGTK